ncbi:MAG: hypothetical protein GTN81_09265 [Proteobacteria bacterium]|nr:hypothetical protein [Pseudomonadota bacterium]
MILKRLFRRKGEIQPRSGVHPNNQEGPRSYNEILEEITQWNIENTRILDILRKELPEQRLTRWSEAFSGGLRKKMRRSETTSDLETYREIYRFICHQRVSLLKEPSMRNAKKLERTDPILLCIICGIRAIQKEMGHEGLIDTIKFGLLEKNLANK